MKTYLFTSVLLAAFILGGCSRSKMEVVPERIEVRPGVYMSNSPSELSLPTSGYTVYIVGETHGNQETKLVFQSYLQNLYKEAGLRAVILEEDQAYETDANAYVQGATETLSDKLCLRADILKQIREFNTSLPAGEKVTVHLVDLDSPLTTIYKHLAELHARLGTAGENIPFPDLDEFRSWRSAPIEELIDTLRNAAHNQPDILNGLDTVQLSMEWYYLGNRLEIDMPRGERSTFAPIREDVTTQNIQHMLSRSNGKPVLAFFGASHGIKDIGEDNFPVQGFKPWAQRLSESGVSVYSLVIVGKSGNGYWHKESFKYEVKGKQQYAGTDKALSPDGMPLVSFFETYPDKEIIYADLRAEENANLRLPSGYDLGIPANQVFDGLIIFKEFTPMEDACPY